MGWFRGAMKDSLPEKIRKIYRETAEMEPPRGILTKVVLLKNLAKLAEKHLYRSFFFNKAAGDSITDFFP